MPVPRRRHCPARRDRRRANHKMTALQGFNECTNCSKPRLSHRVCPNCGEFKGRIYGKQKEADQA